MDGDVRVNHDAHDGDPRRQRSAVVHVALGEGRGDKVDEAVCATTKGVSAYAAAEHRREGNPSTHMPETATVSKAPCQAKVASHTRRCSPGCEANSGSTSTRVKTRQT